MKPYPPPLRLSICLTPLLKGWLTAPASPTQSSPATSAPSCPSSCVQTCSFKLKLPHSSVGSPAAPVRTRAPLVVLTPSCPTSPSSWAAPAPGFKNRSPAPAYHHLLHARRCQQHNHISLQACWAMCALSVGSNRGKITSVQV